MDKYNELIKKIRRQVPVGESFDLLERKLKIGGKSASMFFVDGLVDGGMMQRVIFSLFSLKPEQVENAKNAQEFLESNMPFLDAMVTEDLQQAITFLYSGLVYFRVWRNNNNRLQELPLKRNKRTVKRKIT